MEPGLVAASVAQAGGDAAAAERIGRYLELLQRWGRVHNLVARPTDPSFLARQVVQALAGAPHLDQAGGTLLDVGSGAGLPAVPLLAVRPSWDAVLLEPRQKRWSFLRMVVRELGLRAEVERLRYQEYAGSGFHTITARALGGWQAFLAWAGDRLAEEGAVLLWLSTDEAERLARLEGWRVVRCPLPEPGEGVVLRASPCFT